eukprot:2812505-Amphidinium_carterae.3
MEKWSSADVTNGDQPCEIFALKRLQGGKKGDWNPRNKKGQKTAPDKGSGWKTDRTRGLALSFLQVLRVFIVLTMCCKAPKGAAHGVAEAKDNPELKENPEAALADVTAKKTKTFRSRTTGTTAIATKMDQKTKLIQEAVASRDSSREELVEVYMRVRRLAKEELPLPKETPRIPASFAVLGETRERRCGKRGHTGKQ